jgi:alpha-L-fucosidase
MTMPAWWGARKFGLLIEASAATVPAWAPIGGDASWYRSHLGEGVDDEGVHPSPMVEVLAHHRDRWGHIERYDDFVPLLRFERFDAEAWAELTRASGAGYVVHVSKHHDGWAWWDAPGTTRRMTDDGPQRNVVAEFAAACERNDIVFGTSYSLLDWADRRSGDKAYADEVLHPQVLDLVDRYGTTLLWGDGQWNHDAGHWKTAELMSAVRAIDPEIVINDRWWASASDVPDGAPEIVATFDRSVPDEIQSAPWELRTSIGTGFGHNRGDHPEHHLTGFEIVDLLTEVVAKGGHLLLSVSPTADGTISELQTAPLRDAGTWIRRHAALLADAAPWNVWGDARVRYFATGEDVTVIDIANAGTFSAFDPDDFQVSAVTRIGDDGELAVTWIHDENGLTVLSPADDHARSADRIGIAAYRVTSTPTEPAFELFPAIEPVPTPLAPLLADARPGDIVQLGDGRYVGPVVVPTGVTLRGFGPQRTTITTIASPANAGPTIIPPGPILTLGRGSRVEHLSIVGQSIGSNRFARPLVAMSEPSASLLGVTIGGSVAVAADDVLIRASTAQGVIATDADRLHVSRCHFIGNQWDVGVELLGGGGHQIESNEFAGHLCAVRLDATTGSTVRGNMITARWWGVHLRGCESSRVTGNRLRDTMRAVDVDGGTEVTVDGNAVVNGDSGCVVQRGASQCDVYGNHWERCRVGLLIWGDVVLHHQDNAASGLHDEDGSLLVGP